MLLSRKERPDLSQSFAQSLWAWEEKRNELRERERRKNMCEVFECLNFAGVYVEENVFRSFGSLVCWHVSSNKAIRVS